MPSRPSLFEAGTVVAGKYRVVRLLGQGGLELCAFRRVGAQSLISLQAYTT